jgi:hypothetical protein
MNGRVSMLHWEVICTYYNIFAKMDALGIQMHLLTQPNLVTWKWLCENGYPSSAFGFINVKSMEKNKQ